MAHAEEEDANREKLLEMSLDELLRQPVTSATGGIELDSDLVPANVITITQSDIAAHGWQSVAEVLENVPGLYVVDDHVLPAVSVRGISAGLRSGSRIIKVMINGVEVSFRPDLTAMLGPEYIPIVAVRRIEVARGPLSALYGANAFLATVNIVTRDVEATHAELALRGGLHGPAGNLDSVHGQGGTSALFTTKTGNLKLLLAAHVDRVDRSGVSIERTFPSQNAPSYQPYFAERSKGDWSTPVGLFGQASATSRVGTFSLQGGFQRTDSYGEFQAESVLTHRSRYTLENVWSQAKHEYDWTHALSSTLSVGYSQGTPTSGEKLYLNSYDSSYFRTKLSYRAWDFKGTVLWKHFDELQVLASVDGSVERHRGFEFEQTFVQPTPPRQVGDRLDARAPLDVSISNFAPSVQVIVAPLPDLRLIANGRLDFSNLFDTQSSWRAGASYRISPKLVAKIITGRAFQAPSSVLLYGMPGFGVANTIVGSQGSSVVPVEPQTVHSAEAVLSALPGEHASIVASVFWQEVRQKIEFVSNAVGYTPRNRKTERSVGAEINARLSVGRFSPYGSLTALRALPGDGSDAPPSYPTYWALLGLGMQIPEAFFDVDISLRQVGPRGASQGNAFLNGKPYSLAEYTLVDLAAKSDTFKLLGKEHDTQFSLMVRNLLGGGHSEPGFGGIDVPSLGRTVLLQVRQGF